MPCSTRSGCCHEPYPVLKSGRPWSSLLHLYFMVLTIARELILPKITFLPSWCLASTLMLSSIFVDLVCPYFLRDQGIRLAFPLNHDMLSESSKSLFISSEIGQSRGVLIIKGLMFRKSRTSLCFIKSPVSSEVIMVISGILRYTYVAMAEKRIRMSSISYTFVFSPGTGT